MERRELHRPVSSTPLARRRAVVAVLVALAAGALVAFLLGPGIGPRAKHAATVAPAQPEESVPATSEPAGTALRASAAFARPPSPPPQGDWLWQRRMEETQRALLQKTVYPPTSLPLAGKKDLIPPHHVEPWGRPLLDPKGGKEGRVSVRQTQSTLFLGAGEQGVATFEATADGQHPPVSIARSQLKLTKANESTPGPAVATVVFRDDGAPPDDVAGDGVYSAVVPPSLDVVQSFSGELVIETDLSVQGESGTLIWRFAQTGAAPARFTQTARDALEGGSLAIYLGIQVFTAGHYDIRGRLYDASGRPMAFLTFVDDLGTDTREVRLAAFGKVLRDQNAQPPFTLRDIEGWRYVLGSYPDREQMPMWPDGYTTGPYDLSQFSDSAWNSPEKQARLRALDDAIRRGPSETAPVDSNGIPLPPPPPAGIGAR
jgi:hypothetical protein